MLRIPSLHGEITTAPETIVGSAQVVMMYKLFLRDVPRTSGLLHLSFPSGVQRVLLNTRNKNFNGEGLGVVIEIKIPLAVFFRADEKAMVRVHDLL